LPVGLGVVLVAVFLPSSPSLPATEIQKLPSFSMTGATRGVGAVCDPNDFSGVVEVPAGELGPRHGTVVVDLIEPNHEPISWTNVVRQETFKDAVPWVVIRIAAPN
jgi:hypothetical protein